jgi:hypothetical protein
MSLCAACEALNLESNSRRDASRLGEYDEMLTRADNGCKGCRFFCDVLQSSVRWKGRLSELPGQIVFLSSQRLDVRKPHKLDHISYSCDDLLFDYTVAEDYKGKFSQSNWSPY